MEENDTDMEEIDTDMEVLLNSLDFETRESIIQTAEKKAATWNGKIGLALFPFYEDLIDTHMDRPCIEWSSKMKQSYNIPIIDIHECCQDRDQDWTFPLIVDISTTKV